MKTYSILSLAIAAAISMSAPVGYAQIPSVPEIPAPVPTAASGTVLRLEPESISIRTDSNLTPSQFSYTDGTKFEDTKGSVVSVNIIRPGDPVTVHFSKEGERYLAIKVVVKPMDADVPSTSTVEPARKTSSAKKDGGKEAAAVKPSVTSGAVTEVKDDFITLRTESTTDPKRYKVSPETELVDEIGNAASFAAVKAGVPVTVHYAKNGAESVAKKIVIKTPASP